MVRKLPRSRKEVLRKRDQRCEIRDLLDLFELRKMPRWVKESSIVTGLDAREGWIGINPESDFWDKNGVTELLSSVWMIYLLVLE